MDAARNRKTGRRNFPPCGETALFDIISDNLRKERLRYGLVKPAASWLTGESARGYDGRERLHFAGVTGLKPSRERGATDGPREPTPEGNATRKPQPDCDESRCGELAVRDRRGSGNEVIGEG